MEKDLIRILYQIPCDGLTYDEWLTLGMALHAEGYDVSTWDEWSQTDPDRYEPDVIQKKWSTFDANRADGVAGGTIVEVAKRYGYDPHDGNGMGEALNWDGVAIVQAEQPGLPSAPKRRPDKENDLRLPQFAALPDAPDLTPLDLEPASMLMTYVRSAFLPGDRINVVRDAQERGGRSVPHGFGHTFYPDQLIHNAEEVLGECDMDTGAWLRVNAVTSVEAARSGDGRAYSDADVTSWRNALVECDELPRDKQLEMIMRLRLPCRCIVDSGNKSVHAIVAVDAKDADEFKGRTRALYDYCDANGLPVDHSCRNPSRLTRLPGVRRGDHIQRLIATNVGPGSWDEFVHEVERLKSEQEAKEQTIRDEIEFLDFSSFVGTTPKPRRELIHRLLPHELIMQIVAKGGSGKTYLGIELLFSTLTGGCWLDFQCERGTVLFVDPELHPNDIAARIQEVSTAMGITYQEAQGKFSFISLRGKTKTATVLIDAIACKIAESGKGFDLIIIDSVNAIMEGDENSSVDVRKLYATLQQLNMDVHATMVVIHHTGKSILGKGDMARGSSVFLDAPDVCCELVPLRVDEGTGAWELLRAHDQRRGGSTVFATAWRMQFPKLRTGAPLKPINIIWKYPLHIVDTTGELAECNVLNTPEDAGRRGGQVTAQKAATALERTDAALSEIIAKAHANGGSVRTPDVLPILNEWRKNEGMGEWSISTFKNHLAPSGDLSWIQPHGEIVPKDAPANELLSRPEDTPDGTG
ncbi:MAG: AAA family ATPase [Coriobacteriales bacterium]|nr:AAA family ATPase [Coriobacteriales bacterium]